ncbi:piggyBac transposable element-derived protein 4-like [Schistocerca nitens]|uniref:piggyBac transposable element-derived protein 4-like n=1 Tax=Schistocerca nitens TaxID=7011 RepID=UPI0021174B9E|nr:piggyBac transposable element-derived protein 4-like [Schistocerca nitens]
MHYCLGFYTYRGGKSQEDKAEIARHGLGYCVVQKLLRLGSYLNKGYQIFVDNFFMSVPLVKSLYKLGTCITGTVRKNRKYLPEQFRKKFGIGERMYCKSGPVLACVYGEKKSQHTPVLLLSSKVGAGDIEVQNKNKTVKKPEIIHQYNQYIGGIDTSDMMLYAYLDERRTLRYWKKVAFNIMLRMVLNSYILYKEHSKGRKFVSRYVYTVMIIEALSDEWLQEKNAIDDPRGGPGLRKLPGKKESRCCVCTSQGRKRGSRTVCNGCNKGLHGECFPKHKC